VKAPVGVARYTIDGLSIGAITRLLNEQRIPTRKQPAAGNARRSGPCCVTPPIKVLLASARHRPRHGNASPGRYACVAVLHRVTVHTHEWPRDEWIAIPVPPIIDEQTFALARERPKANKTHAPRRTVVAQCGAEPGVLCQLQLHALPDIDVIGRPHDLLLSLSRFRCLAPARRTDLPQPADPPRSSRSGRMDRDRQAARRARADPERAPTAGGRPHAAPIRQNVAKVGFGAISFVCKRASRAYSPPTKKTFFRSMSCATECPSCASASTRSAPSCNRSQTRRPTAPPIFVSLKR
jgi:hypothetical protein